jgi:L-lactate dehydrogenase (cytochrome)/glycolate oxidase
MADKWFESVAEAKRRAERRLPPSVANALRAGQEAGATIDDNLGAWNELQLAPHVAGAPGERDLATTVMGQSISFPVIISPTGVQAVHPEGEVAVARAAAARGTALGLSSFGSMPIEDVVAANPQTFFQVYWCGTRDHMQQRLDRAKRAGAVGLIVTLDWSFNHSRDWGSPHIPEQLDLREAFKLSPEALRRPKWFATWLKTRQIPSLEVPNMALPGDPSPTFFGAYGEWMGTPPPSWEDIAWLREQWDGPFMVKGIMRLDDAKRAVDLGATTISVSNHGGNNLDSTPASIRALPVIAGELGDQVELVLDSGVRRGSDVVKAVALGAKAVMIGRAYLWGLAANGQAGVENVLDIFRNGIDSTMRALGKASLADLSPADVIVPDGFTRRLGAEDA